MVLIRMTEAFGKFVQKWLCYVNNMSYAFPFSFINVRFHHKEDQDPEVIKLMTLAVMESSRLMVNQPMETACIVFNMEGFTLANMVCFFTFSFLILAL